MPSDPLLSWGRQLGDHLWQSTLFVVAIGILVQALRTNPARVRYRLWMAASLKFLLPFSLLSSIGFFASRFAPPLPAHRISLAIDEIARPLTPLHNAIPTAPTPPSHLWTAAFLSVLALWSLGCVTILLRFWRRWRRVRAIVRAAAPLRNVAGIELLSSPAALEPGVFGIFRPVLYLPAEIAATFSQPELEAILAHELCHLRRRDNLTAALHALVEALFWFHPLVWWLGARLIEERERACDEHVLEAGVEPSVYAECILQVCSQCLQSPSAWVAGITGSSLRKRIEEIMTTKKITRLSSRHKMLLAAAAFAALIGPVVSGIVSGARLRAQPAPAIVVTPSGPKFEVASIKPAPLTYGPPPANAGIRIDAARVDIGYWSISQLIARAYGLPRYQLSAPGWTFNQRFDVAAKFPEGATPFQLPQMLQWLLAERFGLVAHVETRELAGFALLVGKNGAKMKPGEPDSDAAQEPVPTSRLARMGHTLDMLWSYDEKALGSSVSPVAVNLLRFNARRMPMEGLAQLLADRLNVPVIDMTGLQGDYYQVTLDLPIPGAPAGEPVAGLPPVDPIGAMLATVEKLGLKLERRKTPIEVLVVDSVNRLPTAN